MRSAPAACPRRRSRCSHGRTRRHLAHVGALARGDAILDHQYQQLADRMIATPDGFARWRDMAPAVDVLAVRRG